MIHYIEEIAETMEGVSKQSLNSGKTALICKAGLYDGQTVCVHTQFLTISEQDAAKCREGDEYGANAVEAKSKPAGDHQEQKPRL